MTLIAIMFFLMLFLLDCNAFFQYGEDKKKAVHGEWRTPESQLLLWSVLGAFGALSGMLFFRHKTKKRLFRVWTGLFVFLRLLLIAFSIIFLYYWYKGDWAAELVAPLVKDLQAFKS